MLPCHCITISKYHNMLITPTKMHPFRTLRTPLDILLMPFSTMVITQSDLGTKDMFGKYAHVSGPKGSPDMCLNAFHVKFD